MANGGSDVTNGGRFDWRPIMIVALVGVAIGIVNAASQQADLSQAGVDFQPIEPWMWEFTSVVWIVALSPMISVMLDHFPPGRPNWAAMLAAHLAAATVFSLLHVVGMIVLREVIYLALDGEYDFTDGGLLSRLFYEWRKDALTYFGIAAAFWLGRNWRAQPSGDAAAIEAGRAERIEVRDGARVIMLAPDTIVWVQAAGNYVEIHTETSMHTSRQTLSAFAELAGARRLVRVHRSRLVNPVFVRSYQPTASGDVEIEMTDGARLAGSRRFRAALAEAVGQTAPERAAT